MATTRSGRPAKPVELKLLEGRMTEAEASRHPRPTSPAPEKPAWLSPDASAEWDRVAPELERLKLLTGIDGASLAAYCEAWAVFKAAAKDVQERGIMVDGARDKRAGLHDRAEKVRNTALLIMSDAAKTMRAYASEFGLTPQSRARMQLPGGQDEEDDAERFFREGSM